MIKVSIIIVNYNTKELTKQCIDSIFEQTNNIDFDVILVDNNSTDGSEDYFSKDSRIVFVESGGNIGFGRANNLGFMYANGDYIFLLNSDTIIYSNVIREMALYLDENEHIGCVGTILRDENLKPVHSFGRFPLWYEELIPIKRKRSNYLNKYPAAVEMITGADVMIRRNVIDRFGLFDSDFFMYYEDAEMFYRYKKNGVISTIVDIPGIIHLEGASSKVPFRKVVVQNRGFFLYISKTYSPIIALFAKVVIALKRSVTVWGRPWTMKEKINYVCQLISGIVK